MAIGPCAQVPPDYGETGIGVAVGNSFVEVGIADSGSGAEAVVGGDGLVVGVGDPRAQAYGQVKSPWTGGTGVSRVTTWWELASWTPAAVSKPSWVAARW